MSIDACLILRLTVPVEPLKMPSFGAPVEEMSRLRAHPNVPLMARDGRRTHDSDGIELYVKTATSPRKLSR